MAGGLISRYEAAAPGWGRRLAQLGFPAAYRAIVSEAVRRLPVPAGKLTGADLGCGDGAFAEALLDVLGGRLSLTLLDASAAMLRAAEARLGPRKTRMIQCELGQSDLPPDGHDLVSAAHLVEHLPDLHGALLLMARLLRPGGVLILTVSRPHWCSRLVWVTWRHRRYSEAEVCAALARAGLTEIQCWEPQSGPPRRLSLAYAARRPR